MTDAPHDPWKPPAAWRVPRELIPWDLSRPPTDLERAGAFFERWAKRSLVAAVLVAALTGIVIAVPTYWVVPRSASYGAACAFIANHPQVKDELEGGSIGCSYTPGFYHFEQGGVRYGFVVESSAGRVGSAHVFVTPSADGTWHVASATFVRAELGAQRVRTLATVAAPGSGSR